MTRGVRTTVLLCIGFVVIVLGMLFFSTQQEPELSEEQLRERGTFVLPTPREVTGFELTDQRGGAFTPDDLQGHWTFVFFGFTSCPDICPIALSVLAQVERSVRELNDPAMLDGYRVVLVTVDPENDDPETLGRYVEAFSDRFVGVTGSPEAIATFATQVNVAFMKVPSGEGGYTVDHTGNIVIFNPRGHYHGFIRMPHEAENILLTYHTLAANW